MEFQASKYDLENLAIGQKAVIDISGKAYEGTVTKINKMATPNSSGVPMVAARVHIDNPDSNVYLGIEARLKITTAQRQDALLLPVEAVYIDNDGNICYIIENGALLKKYITTGISSSDYIEVTDGLSEKEEVVTCYGHGSGRRHGSDTYVRNRNQYDGYYTVVSTGRTKNVKNMGIY